MTRETLSLIRHQAFINGQWCDSQDKQSFSVLNPASGDIIASVPDMGEEDTRAAIDSAYQAFPAWKALTGKERSAHIYKWYQLILEYAEELAALLSREQGKPFHEARTEVLGGADYVLWAAEEAKRLYGDYIPAHKRDARIFVTKEPVGVVGAITPWNFPSSMVTRKVPMALAAGCTVVLKPAEDTPLSALALAVLAEQAGVPAGVFNIVTASLDHAPYVGDVLTSDSRVRKLSFTGSTEVGRLLLEKSAADIKKLSLELGGNAPFIVFESADQDQAVAGLIACKLRNAGQTCVCANRIFVQDTIYETIIEKFNHTIAQLTIGAGMDDGTDIGPLVNIKGVEKVESLIQDALAHGAQLQAGGSRHAKGGNFFELTTLSDMTDDMQCFSQEIFGPVAAFYRFSDEQEVVDKANKTDYGLAAYLYSQDQAQIWRVMDGLEYGMVAVNEPLLTTELAPFGGVKHSGLGREGSKYGLDEFVNLKYRMIGNC